MTAAEQNRAAVRTALSTQAESCRSIGSPLYATVLDGLAADHDRGGLTATLLDGLSEHPQRDAIPLRYLACGHRLALAGKAPELARHYPSCGGEWDHTARVAQDFLRTVAAHLDEFRAGVRRNVQTNEVGRAPVLASGFALVGRRFGLPIDQLEIGSSAGLLSNWDRFHYDTGRTTMGDADSPVRFDASWWVPPAPELGDVTVERRRASDVSPIDISTAEGRLTSTSFVWPDQVERFDRLRAALVVAAEHRVEVDAADAGAWLTDQLAGGPTVGRSTVVFHSIVWQYLPTGTRSAVRAAIALAGQRATERSPVLWMRMEPAGPEHADLRLTTYSGGPEPTEEVLALVGYHGAGVRWRA